MNLFVFYPRYNCISFLISKKRYECKWTWEIIQIKVKVHHPYHCCTLHAHSSLKFFYQRNACQHYHLVQVCLLELPLKELIQTFSIACTQKIFCLQFHTFKFIFFLQFSDLLWFLILEIKITYLYLIHHITSTRPSYILFFSCVKGNIPKVGERVLVEATYNPNMPFKWNATRIQLLPNQVLLYVIS